MNNRNLLFAALTFSLSLSALAENWPAWRGPRADGICTETNLPLHWSKTENVRWRVPLPQPGNSTPIVWGHRIFVTQPITEGNRGTVMCFDRANGKLLWQSGVAIPFKERTHKENTYSAGSAVTDGERVVCWFGSAGVVAYDLDGKELWRTDLGKHDHEFGYGGSPVIHGDRVFLNFGPGVREFLVALDKKTGKELWRHQSPVPGVDNIDGAWGTPLVLEGPRGTQVISALRGDLAGLDPATGKVLWRAPTGGLVSKSSPVVGDGILVMEWEKEHPVVAIRLGDTGTVSESNVLWKHSPPKQRVATAVIHGGMVFGVQRDGFAECTKLETGVMLWSERLKGPGANTKLWSSPLLSGDRLYAMNQSGDTFIYRASSKFELIGVNSLGEMSNSSVVPSNGELFLRTHAALWCIGGK
jgi:outer membrane protein assembly factor BamB